MHVCVAGGLPTIDNSFLISQNEFTLSFSIQDMSTLWTMYGSTGLFRPNIDHQHIVYVQYIVYDQHIV